MKIEKFESGVATAFKPMYRITVNRQEARKIIETLMTQENNGLPERVNNDYFSVEFLLEHE